MPGTNNRVFVTAAADGRSYIVNLHHDGRVGFERVVSHDGRAHKVTSCLFASLFLFLSPFFYPPLFMHLETSSFHSYMHAFPSVSLVSAAALHPAREDGVHHVWRGRNHLLRRRAHSNCVCILLFECVCMSIHVWLMIGSQHVPFPSRPATTRCMISIQSLPSI